MINGVLKTRIFILLMKKSNYSEMLFKELNRSNDLKTLICIEERRSKSQQRWINTCEVQQTWSITLMIQSQIIKLHLPRTGSWLINQKLIDLTTKLRWWNLYSLQLKALDLQTLTWTEFKEDLNDRNFWCLLKNWRKIKSSTLILKAIRWFL